MSQIYKCPHCKQALSVTDDLLNTEVECPSCQNVITLSAAPMPVVAVPKPVRAVPQPSPQSPAVAPASAGAAPATTGKGSKGLVIGLIAGAIVLGVGSLGAVGVTAYVMTRPAPEKPPEITPLEKEEKLLREQIAEAEKEETKLTAEAGDLNSKVEVLRTNLKEQAAEVDALTTERNSLTGGVP